MASTSASLVKKSFKYDVFLSFRGEDTRKNFVDHLYYALQQKGIITYKDDERIEKGERINDQLITSIEDSRFYIIVFSKNYASSSWCLDELAKIMECQKMTEHTAYPIFYDVEPTEVRNQSGLVGEAFDRFTRKRKLEDVELEKEVDVGRWRNALKEAAGLAGMELKNTFNGHEAKFIQRIVKDISLKPYFINSSIDEKLVGMETRVKDVVSSLEIDLDDVRMIGIKGMGGGGKTTLARAVFDHISVWFEGKIFVEDVREVSKCSLSGLKELQKQILSALLNDQSIVVTSVYEGKNMMKKIIPSRKVLLVLDDVDDICQLEALAGEPTWFKPGSRIIITTRDEQVLVAHRVNFIHDINLLSDEEAICLFSRYALGREIHVQRYEELSGKVVSYAAGLPLTVKVLGSHLCGRSEHEWVDAIEKLKRIPLEKTLKRLELSYNGLDNDEKEIFLDVVCLLKGEKKDDAIRILESCGFNAHIGLRILEQKSLINISDIDGLRFHDHIEEMGWNIVRGLYPEEPSRHSRLWIKEEIEDILINESGTGATRSLKLNNTILHTDTITRGLRNMRELKFLSVHKGYREWTVDEVSNFLPDALRSLYWPQYPFRSLPKSFRANKLVNLEMCGSNIHELWEGGERKVLNKIRFLDFTCSELRTFDLSMTPNLEKLVLEGCFDLRELHMPIEFSKLKILNLTGSKVSNLNLGMTPHLEKLNLEGCNEFVELHLPIECPILKSIDLSGSKVRNLNLGMTPHLENLNLEGCKEFAELHLPVQCLDLKFLCLCDSKIRKLNLGMTPHLEKLNLGRCNEFEELHMPMVCPKLNFLNLNGSKVGDLNLGMTPHLKKLNLQGCENFVELHVPVECLNLQFLYLSGSKVKTLNLGMTPRLEMLYLRECNDFEELHMPVECSNLKFLDLCNSKVSRLNLRMTPRLETLNLQGCNYFVELQMLVECPKLKLLYLSGSKVSKLNLGMTPHLEKLDLERCYLLQEVHAPVGCLKKLVYLNLSGCSRFEKFLVDKSLESTGLDFVATLTLIAESLDKCPLHPNSNLPKYLFKCKYHERLPSSCGNLEKLISFGLCACTDLESFSASICGLQHLRALTLAGSIAVVPKDLYKLESLVELTFLTIHIKHLPDSICMMKCLRFLKLNSSWLLEQLPNDVGSLECLEELHLVDCISLRDIPNSICEMKALTCLVLSNCILVKKLPEELGRLKCLKTLNIDGSGISHLPPSIYQLIGLCIFGSRRQLKSYGFTSVEKASEDSYYIRL